MSGVLLESVEWYIWLVGYNWVVMLLFWLGDV